MRFICKLFGHKMVRKEGGWCLHYSDTCSRCGHIEWIVDLWAWDNFWTNFTGKKKESYTLDGITWVKCEVNGKSAWTSYVGEVAMQ